ncbi:MAG TPA: hypothetical protein VFL16_01665 [Steroidobacteraceae bacterium]|nr:hypothetical protein [Steroidobacteraceae bacterium]
MNRNPLLYLLALAGAASLAGPASAGPVAYKSDYLPLEKNLAFELDAPGAVRANVQVYAKDLGEGLKFELTPDGHGLITGGVYAPPGDARQVTVVAFDEKGEAIYRGDTVVNIGKELTAEFDVPLKGGDLEDPLEARFGSQLLTAGIVASTDELTKVQLTLKDPLGTNLPYKPDDIFWELPEGFPEIKYSCFGEAACILEWKPTLEQQTIYFCLKLKPQPCVKHIPDLTGPYRYVATGRAHTCAITKHDDIFCWGDNQDGQLGAPTTQTCQFSDCSLVPIAIQCPAGEACKWRALAAGWNHTCAVDTNGKAWCWGEDGNFATGEWSQGKLPKHALRQIPARTFLGATANFVAIDTNIGHTCALTSAQDLFCWGDNSRGELGWPNTIVQGTPTATMIANGNKYQSIVTGDMHSCAIQVNGLLDCWGDNSQFQLTGNANSAIFITVNSKIPLLTGKTVRRVAAGQAATCAENSDDNTVCWGKPTFGGSSSLSNPGFIALAGSSSTSLATEVHDCGLGFQNCSHTCLTDSGGDLFCRNWVRNVTPGQLGKMIKPWPDFGVDYTQVDVGQTHACAVTDQHDIWCWGMNDFGQFGTGVMSSNMTFEPRVRTNR